MGASKIKQVQHSQQAYTFCCISTIVKIKFINEGVMFCTFSVQLCVTEAEPNFHIFERLYDITGDSSLPCLCSSGA